MVTNWIWTEQWTQEDDSRPRIVYFRRAFDLQRIPRKGDASLSVSADTRYKLYINGVLVQTGPQKGDRQVWYLDEMDVADYLRVGENVLAVAVLRYPLAGHEGNHSLFRTQTPGLYLRFGFGGQDLSTDASWRCRIDRNVCLTKEEQGFAPLCFHEKASLDPELFRWNGIDYDDSAWPNARPYLKYEMSEAISPAGLSPRTIPFLYRKERRFAGVVEDPAAQTAGEDWLAFLREDRPLTIPPHCRRTVTLDAGEEMNGYLSLAMTGGAGAQIDLLEAECYSLPSEGGSVKGNRLDHGRGTLVGYRDSYTAAGIGSAGTPEVYEPYWFRTFRFVRLTIRTEGEALTLCSFHYEETGYPLEARSTVSASDPSLSPIWELSLRTLKRCMLETYVDCPFYEQLQYAMDTRSEILYTYAVSGDDRLARNAIEDFSRAQRADGLLNCCYPNVNPNVIPGFSLYYILMLHDHMMYFGDRRLIRSKLRIVDGILDYFDGHLTPEGLVGNVGGVIYENAFWSFIDWAEPWLPTSGMPPAGLNGPITMESLLYLLGLQRAAELAEYADRPGTAEEYRKRAAALQEAIRAHCMNEAGMITDGPGSTDVSQHGQVFGVLTGVLNREEGRKSLLETILNPGYARCTVAMRYYLFRALEETDLYEYTDQYWDLWREMVKNGCTTSVESDTNPRSECHAWGALALYELPSVVLGVRPAAPGYEKIRVAPVPGTLTYASGTVYTPVGEIGVSWKKREEGLELRITCAEDVRSRLID